MSPRFEVVVARGQRLDTAVVDGLPDLSRAQAARLIAQGHVAVNGRVAGRASLRAEAGDTLTVEVPPAAPSRVEAQDLPLTVVFEDDAVAVVDKPAGMVVHPAPGHADGTLVNALLHHLDGLSSVGGEQRPGLVHRLDRGTSGLLVVAKTDVAHRSLAAQFADHSAGRVYLAWVHDPPDRDRGRIESRLARHPTDRLRFASTAEADRGRRAVTHWEVRGRAGTVGLVTCRLETGRTHQVRVHLSELGAPLLGDRLYARRGASAVPSRLREAVDPSGDRPLLHAWTLAFVHPTTGAALRFVAPPPPDIVRVGAILGIPLETP